MRPLPAVPLTKPAQRKLARSTRLKGWEYCTVCGEGRYLPGHSKRKTGMCITCLRANPPELKAPYLCLMCGATEPEKFTKKGRKRCAACILATHRKVAKEERARLSAYFATLPQCWVCDLKDSHVIDGLCALCVEELGLSASVVAAA